MYIILYLRTLYKFKQAAIKTIIKYILVRNKNMISDVM